MHLCIFISTAVPTNCRLKPDPSSITLIQTQLYLRTLTEIMSNQPSNESQDEEGTPNFFEPRFEPAGPSIRFEDISKERQATSQLNVATSTYASSPSSSQRVEPSINNDEPRAKVFGVQRTRWKLEDTVSLMKLVAEYTEVPISHLPWDQIQDKFNDGQRSHRTRLGIELKYWSLVNTGATFTSLEQQLEARQTTSVFYSEAESACSDQCSNECNHTYVMCNS